MLLILRRQVMLYRVEFEPFIDVIKHMLSITIKSDSSKCLEFKKHFVISTILISRRNTWY